VSGYRNASPEEERMVLTEVKDALKRRNHNKREVLVHVSLKGSEEFLFIRGWDLKPEVAIGVWCWLAARPLAKRSCPVPRLQHTAQFTWFIPGL